MSSHMLHDTEPHPALADAALGERQPSPGSRRAALVVFCVSFGLFLALAPVAKQPLAAVPLFIPVNQIVLIVNDLLTVVLLLGQLRLARSRPLLALTCGYLFSAVMATIHMLSFPGAFAARGVVGGGAQSTAYLYVSWHIGIALFAIAYALLRNRDGGRHERWTARPPVWMAATILAALGIAQLVLAHGDSLPPILAGNTYSTSFNFFRHGQWVLMAAAVLAVWWTPRRSVLDLWLAVALCASVFEIGLVAILNAGRYDVGFYAGRVYALFASCCVLVMLLIEQVKLHADLARARDDIAQQVRAERALREADTRKDEFLATLSHELRNPLAPIRNAVYLLSRSPALPKPAADAVAILDRQSLHMTRLVDDLLEISRITQGKLHLQKERVSLNACVRDAVEAVRDTVASARQLLHVAMPSEELLLDADGTRITQCVVNLLTNASKFTPRGGTVRVALAVSGHCAHIAVVDTGVGIAPEHLERIFEKFSQVTPALQRTHGGLGIGLALVKALVQLHGGQVRATSPGPGQGSTFEISLPLAGVREQRAHSATEDAPVVPNARQRVLVVDDNIDAATLLAAGLKIAGHEVRQAHDGLECLHVVREFEPDVIFMDLGMPVMNGLETARALRAEGNRCFIVAVTGWDQERDRDATRRSGFDLHLRKPVDIDEVTAIVAGLRERELQT